LLRPGAATLRYGRVSGERAETLVSKVVRQIRMLREPSYAETRATQELAVHGKRCSPATCKRSRQGLGLPGVYPKPTASTRKELSGADGRRDRPSRVPVRICSVRQLRVLALLRLQRDRTLVRTLERRTHSSYDRRGKTHRNNTQSCGRCSPAWRNRRL
jgi:hypothetical protein